MASSDSFDRADSATTLGTADTGETWTVLYPNTTWGIKDNQAYCVDATDEVAGAVSSIAVIDTGLADCQIDVDIVDSGLVGGDDAGGLAFRATDKDNWYIFRENQLRRSVAGVTSALVTFTPPITDGDHLTVVLRGQSVKCYVNGVLEAEATDTDHESVTKHGLHSADQTAPPTNRFDNFTVRALSGWTVGYIGFA